MSIQIEIKKWSFLHWYTYTSFKIYHHPPSLVFYSSYGSYFSNSLRREESIRVNDNWQVSSWLKTTLSVFICYVHTRHKNMCGILFTSMITWTCLQQVLFIVSSAIRSYWYLTVHTYVGNKVYWAWNWYIFCKKNMTWVTYLQN